MNKHISLVAILLCGSFSINAVANSGDYSVPDSFQRFDTESKLVINYTDLNSLLDAVVLNTGRSDRNNAISSQAKTGTRMTVKVNRATINEGNRFYYEIFEGNEKNQQTLRDIRGGLEEIPSFMPLEKFSRDEQLAYWINLYNVTILDEIVKVYPKRDLEQLLVGEESILTRKILTVAGIPLSLNDIQFTILKQNYEGNPLIIYGLYQGIIGGPNIRKNAYTGKYVYADLIDNAIEFINSNRGTESKSKSTFRVSSLYERNKAFFNDSDTDLTTHLLTYLEGKERSELSAATGVTADINDWTVTDLFGSYREPAGSIADSRAALIGSTRGASSGKFISNTPAISRYNPAVMGHLQELNQKRDEDKTGHVTVEELGEAATENNVVNKDDNKKD